MALEKPTRYPSHSLTVETGHGDARTSVLCRCHSLWAQGGQGPKADSTGGRAGWGGLLQN